MKLKDTLLIGSAVFGMFTSPAMAGHLSQTTTSAQASHRIPTNTWARVPNRDCNRYDWHRWHYDPYSFYFSAGYLGGYGYPYSGYSPYGYDGYGYRPYGYGYNAAPEPYGYRDVNGDRSVVVRVQQRLARAGYYRGAIDGVMGRGTHNAIRGYERSHGLRIDGQIDRQLLATMGLA
ncbi:MAG: peptidoglycan-binding domain-containing protein [Chthoniobacterales bacterium]